jgi:hypothetical protein
MVTLHVKLLTFQDLYFFNFSVEGLLNCEVTMCHHVANFKILYFLKKGNGNLWEFSA